MMASLAVLAPTVGLGMAMGPSAAHAGPPPPSGSAPNTWGTLTTPVCVTGYLYDSNTSKYIRINGAYGTGGYTAALTADRTTADGWDEYDLCDNGTDSGFKLSFVGDGVGENGWIGSVLNWTQNGGTELVDYNLSTTVSDPLTIKCYDDGVSTHFDMDDTATGGGWTYTTGSPYFVETNGTGSFDFNFFYPSGHDPLCNGN